MANNSITINKIRQILRLHSRGLSKLKIAAVSAADLIKYNKQNNANSTISLQFKPLGKINSVEDIKKQIGI